MMVQFYILIINIQIILQKEIIYTAQRIDIQLFVSINKDNSIREMVFFDNEGNILKVPKEIENFFTQKNIKHINNINEVITGIISFNDNKEFLLFYARGVFWFGDDYTKSHGTRVWGRVINDELLKIYSDFIGYKIKIIPIQYLDITELEPLNKYKKFLYNVQNKNLLYNEGYIIINDFFNKPAFYFYLNLPKIYFKESLLTLSLIILLIAFLAFYSLKTLLKSVDKIVISRIENFNKEIHFIKVNHQLNKEIIISKNEYKDEIHIL